MNCLLVAYRLVLFHGLCPVPCLRRMTCFGCQPQLRNLVLRTLCKGHRRCLVATWLCSVELQARTIRWPELAHGNAGTKQQLHQMYEARQVIQFAEFYPVGHRSTDYPKFFSSSAPYAVKFKTGYEPYILVSRRAMPWYDERFRGYGWDKVRWPCMPQELKVLPKYFQQNACQCAAHPFSAACHQHHAAL